MVAVSPKIIATPRDISSLRSTILAQLELRRW